MKYLLLLTLVPALAIAQTCIVPAPVAPPAVKRLEITFPDDGGIRGCTYKAYTTNGAAPNEYAGSNAKCDQAGTIGRQAVANDNGWNDGGVP